jgi:hypothetical protein
MAGYAWTLPQIDQISAQVKITNTDLSPDLGFTNALALDLSKDFYPFGEKPRFNDTFYLANGEVFANGGAEVIICRPGQSATGKDQRLRGLRSLGDLERTGLAGDQRSGAASPSSDSSEFKTLDNTKAFTVSDSVTFPCQRRWQAP